MTQTGSASQSAYLPPLAEASWRYSQRAEGEGHSKTTTCSGTVEAWAWRRRERVSLLAEVTSAAELTYLS